MQRFASTRHLRPRARHLDWFRRVLVFALVLSMTVPLPLAGGAATPDAPGREDRMEMNGDAASVHARLNGPERAAAIKAARQEDAAARASFARGEDGTSLSAASPASSPSADSSAPAAQQGAPTAQSAERIVSPAETLFNGAAGLLGLPGLQGDRQDPYARHDSYDPNADQGRGFHEDGTARRADGATGNNAASGSFDGRRAAGYASHGLGPGLSGRYGAADDPLRADNWDMDDSMDGRAAAGRTSMDGYGLLGATDPHSYLMQRGLNHGMGFLNSMGEAALGGLTDNGRARLNFMTDWDGKLNGEGDVLLPWYDGKYTTVFSQFGARTMNAEDSRDRWIGNLGLGQRWYPFATGGDAPGDNVDSGNWMLGYNAFYDHDFTRGHQRGGVGLEGQYDWLRISPNYYFPVSGWKDSEDFDGDFVKERAAEGWDVRVKGYLPFYRNVALTGAFTQWYGDHVGMFGAGHLEKDPKVWSYGLEYTPVPLVSGFINQRNTERGRTDTEFGLRLTYLFGMPWEQQTSHDKVAELRTVQGSRHEFVDRENRIILEYKAKNNYRVEFTGRDGNVFSFRIRNGFDEYMAGQTVRVTASGVTSLAQARTAPATFLAQAGDVLGGLFSVREAHAATLSQAYTTGRDGTFRVTVTGLAAGATLSVQGGGVDRTFTAAELTGGAASYAYDLSNLGISDTFGAFTGNITVTNIDDNMPAAGVSVTLSYRTTGGTRTARSTTINLGLTDVNGQIPIPSMTHFLSDYTPRRIQLSAGNYATSVERTFRSSKIPGGFLTGLSFNSVTPQEAKDACISHGGRLPRLSDGTGYADSLPSVPPNSSWQVEGIGHYGAAWPADSDPDIYQIWLGTSAPNMPSDAYWIAYKGGSNISLATASGSAGKFLCLP